MTEFKLWMIVVTLLIFCIMLLSFTAAYLSKQVSKAEVMLLRLEEKEKKREKPRIDPKPSGDDDRL
jgi:hypothetical protein